MLFSILVASYNNGRFFKDCFESILAQTYQEWEVIIVDDCSTDNSIEIIQALTKDDARFKVFVNEENKGCGFTKRRCAELAGGFICGFLDPDDAILPDALQLMITAHKEHPQVSLVHATFYYCDEQLNIRDVYSVPKQVEVDERFTNLEARVNHFSTFKRDRYTNTDGIASNLLRAVDQDLYLKLSEQGPFFYLDKPLYKYRIHQSGIATASNDKAFYWFLKVIAKAEERRGINLENEIAAYLNRTDPANMRHNLSNPRYLVLQFIHSFKAKPAAFLKKLFLNE